MPEPRKKLTERLKELAERVGSWLDQLLPTPKPELVPVPARRPRRR